jgi:signal transduction histidine kinase
VKPTRPSGLTLLVVALLLLLPALAVLQYRWVGQVSDAERERMHRNLQVAAVQFREAFDYEIARAVNSLRPDAATVRDRAWDSYADRYAMWADTTEHPGIVANVFILERDAGDLRVRRWNSARHSFDATEWLPVLTPWRERLEQAMRAFTTGDPVAPVAAPDDPSLLFTLLLNPGARPSEPQTVPARMLFGFTVVQLDMNYVRDVLLPAMVERHFMTTGAEGYRVAIVHESNPGDVVYASEPGVSIGARSADVVEPLHIAFRDPLTFIARGSNAGLNDAQRTSDQGGWALLVQHQRGSLEAAVAGVRRRNLGISFGVLMLLTVSIVVLAVSSRRAEHLARQQMEFVAGVSHELRTPVAVIRSAAENLSHGVVGSGDRVKQYGQVIEAEASRLDEMVEQVLHYAGISSRHGSGARVPLEPADIIASAIDSIRATDGSALPVHLERTIAPNLPRIAGDATALRSAVQNLLANAVKYGGAEQWVGVRAEQSAGRPTEVLITIEDHGPGIPGSELPHIFEPFYRGRDAMARQVRGNGLGLALVQRIVAAHGGRVSVTTRLGSGSAFTIHLPAMSPDAHVCDVAANARGTNAAPRAAQS